MEDTLTPDAPGRTTHNRLVSAAFLVLFVTVATAFALIWRDVDARERMGRQREMELGTQVGPDKLSPMQAAERIRQEREKAAAKGSAQ